MRGSCLCGGLRYEITGRSLGINYCHCRKCRKASGTAFATNMAVAENEFAIRSGAENLASFESSPGKKRHFCRVCGSRAPGRSPDGKHYYVPAGLLDDDPGVRGAFHMFVGSKAPWFEITDELPRFEGWVPGYGPDDQK